MSMLVDVRASRLGGEQRRFQPFGHVETGDGICRVMRCRRRCTGRRGDDLRRRLCVKTRNCTRASRSPDRCRRCRGRRGP